MGKKSRARMRRRMGEGWRVNGGVGSRRGSKREEQKEETWQRKLFREWWKYLGKFYISEEQTLLIFK